MPTLIRRTAQRRPNVEAMRRAIRSGRLTTVGDEMVNLLEPAALSEYPVLSTIKEELRRQGAAGVLMSGSGPTVYGLFERQEAAAGRGGRLPGAVSRIVYGAALPLAESDAEKNKEIGIGR